MSVWFHLISKSPSSSACSSSQPPCSAPAAVRSARIHSDPSVIMHICREKTEQNAGLPMHVGVYEKQEQWWNATRAAIYPTLASANLPSFLVDPCFLCAKYTTNQRGTSIRGYTTHAIVLQQHSAWPWNEKATTETNMPGCTLDWRPKLLSSITVDGRTGTVHHSILL